MCLYKRGRYTLWFFWFNIMCEYSIWSCVNDRIDGVYAYFCKIIANERIVLPLLLFFFLLPVLLFLLLLMITQLINSRWWIWVNQINTNRIEWNMKKIQQQTNLYYCTAIRRTQLLITFDLQCALLLRHDYCHRKLDRSSFVQLARIDQLCFSD